MNTSPLRNRQSAPAFLSHLHTLRVGNLSPKYDDEELLHDFEAYGVIGDFYRPKDTRNGNARAVPYRYAFVRFFSDEDAENARRALHGQERYGEEMTVEYAVQESKFSNSTGFITNYEIVEPPRELADFDPSMPASHREKKIEEWASQVDEVYTLKVVGLNTDITYVHGLCPRHMPPPPPTPLTPFALTFLAPSLPVAGRNGSARSFPPSASSAPSTTPWTCAPCAPATSPWCVLSRRKTPARRSAVWTARTWAGTVCTHTTTTSRRCVHLTAAIPFPPPLCFVRSGPLQVFFWEQQRYFSKTPFVTVQPPKGKEKAAAHKRAIRFDL